MKRTTRSLVWLALAGALSSVGHAQTCSNATLSLLPSGASFNSESDWPILSGDGRFVAFRSYATNFPGASSGTVPQLYVLDRATGAFEHVSRSTGGDAAFLSPGWGGNTLASFTPRDVSADGRFVLFLSPASNLVPDDTNQNWNGTHAPDVFVRDRQNGTTMTPNTLPDGSTGAYGSYLGRMSADGRWIVFTTRNAHSALDTNASIDAYLFDRLSGAKVLASTTAGGVPVGDVVNVDVSDDGRFVVFDSYSAGVVPGDANGGADTFVRDMLTGAVELISVNSLGVQGNASTTCGCISADGRFVLMSTFATNLGSPSVGGGDLFVRDRASATTTLASVKGNGTPVGFDLGARFDMSADGRYVLFESDASNVLPGDFGGKNDVFLRDRWSGQTSLVSEAAAGGFTGAVSEVGALSADGRKIAFSSGSAVLTQPPLPNGVKDVFLRSCTPSAPTTYCVSQPNSLGCRPSIGFVGVASASAGSGFDVQLTNTLSQRSGLLFYSVLGSRLVPFGGGFACVQTPLRRTALQSSGGNTNTLDCSGSFHLDFNAHVASGADPALAAGVEVWSQYWSRDGGAPSGVNLSDALWLLVGP